MGMGMLSREKDMVTGVKWQVVARELAATRAKQVRQRMSRPE